LPAKNSIWELSLYSQGSIDLHYKYIDPFNYYLYKPETHELFAISLKSLHDDQLSLSPLCLEKHYHNWSRQFKTWPAFNEKELVWNPYIMLLLFTFVSFNYFQSSNEARFQLSFKLQRNKQTFIVSERVLRHIYQFKLHNALCIIEGKVKT